MNSLFPFTRRMTKARAVRAFGWKHNPLLHARSLTHSTALQNVHKHMPKLVIAHKSRPSPMLAQSPLSPGRPATLAGAPPGAFLKAEGQASHGRKKVKVNH